MPSDLTSHRVHSTAPRSSPMLTGLYPMSDARNKELKEQTGIPSFPGTTARSISSPIKAQASKDYSGDDSSSNDDKISTKEDDRSLGALALCPSHLARTLLAFSTPNSQVFPLADLARLRSTGQTCRSELLSLSRPCPVPPQQ